MEAGEDLIMLKVIFDKVKTRRILFALLVTLIFNNTAFGSGPVVNGFYIGMPRQKAIDNINKLGLIMDINRSNDSIKLFIPNKTGLYGLIEFNDDVIYLLMFIPKLAFNLQAMDFNKFIYEFCVHYKIPYEKLIKRSDSMYSYSDYDEGYHIGFTTEDITIGFLQRPSELQFK
jgi:hypothetical protein